MDIFNLKSNDVKDFKRFMDMKAPAFGGPNETESFDKSKRKSLKEWTNIVKRDPNFENGGKNHNNDGYWKAFHSDVPSRAAKVKIEEPLNTPQFLLLETKIYPRLIQPHPLWLVHKKMANRIQSEILCLI